MTKEHNPRNKKNFSAGEKTVFTTAALFFSIAMLDAYVHREPGGAPRGGTVIERLGDDVTFVKEKLGLKN